MGGFSRKKEEDTCRRCCSTKFFTILTPGSLWCTTIFPISSKKSLKRQFCRETSWQKPNHGADDEAQIELAAFLKRRRKFSILERYHRCSSAFDMETKKKVRSAHWWITVSVETSTDPLSGKIGALHQNSETNHNALERGNRAYILFYVILPGCSTGLHNLFHPTIRDGSTWSKFGAHGEHRDVFPFSN